MTGPDIRHQAVSRKLKRTISRLSILCPDWTKATDSSCARIVYSANIKCCLIYKIGTTDFSKYDRTILIGFAMYGYFPEPVPGQLWPDRLLIDKKHQGKGYGKQAVLLLLDRLHTEYQSGTVYLSVYENNPHAVKLYQQIGFKFNGKYDSKGERVMEYHF